MNKESFDIHELYDRVNEKMENLAVLLRLYNDRGININYVTDLDRKEDSFEHFLFISKDKHTKIVSDFYMGIFLYNDKKIKALIRGRFINYDQKVLTDVLGDCSVNIVFFNLTPYYEISTYDEKIVDVLIRNVGKQI